MNTTDLMSQMAQAMAAAAKPPGLDAFWMAQQCALRFESANMTFVRQMQEMANSTVFQQPLLSIMASARVEREFLPPEWLSSLKYQNDRLSNIHSLGLPKTPNLVNIGAATDPSWNMLARLSFAAESRLADIDWKHAGSLLEINPSRQTALVRSHARLSRSLADVIAHLKPCDEDVEESSGTVAAASAEVFIAAETVASVSPSINRHCRSCENGSLAQIGQGNILWPSGLTIDSDNTTLESHLQSLHPGLPKMLEGARQALRSDNPDRVRHFHNSLRELSTHVLHHLAPTEKVSGWTQDPKDYSQTGPTRHARVRYIARGISTKPFATFIESDIKACVALFDLLNAGTHALEFEATTDQCRMVFFRVEQMLLFLFNIAEISGRK